MSREIERKFLVVSDAWRAHAEGVRIRQGYLSSRPEATVRVRVMGEKAFLTVKGLTRGVERLEFEYEIPKADAEAMLESIAERPILQKTRWRVEDEGCLWEIDEFEGENAGLVVAEIELPSADAAFPRPAWLGREVSSEARYFNSNLLARPWSAWSEAEKSGVEP